VDAISVRFLPDNVTVEARRGQTLLDVALEAGIFVRAACGGTGACGQCKVKVIEGAVSVSGDDKLDSEERAQGYVLACRAQVEGTVVIEVPQAKVGRKVIPRDEAERMRVTAAPMESPITPEFSPLAATVFVSPPRPTAVDNIADWDRVSRTLRTEHEISPVRADLDAIRRLPSALRGDDWKITAILEFEDAPDGQCRGYRLRGATPGHVRETPVALAVDIGTTSLWGELIELGAGRVLARSSRYNPQISMGDDVISRIVFSLKKDGLDKLQRAAADGINEIIAELIEKSGKSLDSIRYMIAAGNTVMTHLFLGLYPKYLRESPYVPVGQNFDSIPAAELGLKLPSHAFVRMFPGVASYVGGDIVSGVLANGMWMSDEMTLFIDIGTNGEIVAGNKDLLMTASCSAGPAFEGGGLEYGMRAAPGAIESILIDPEGLDPMIKTIDAKPALGICGSGVINIISQMLRTGILSRNGKYVRDLPTDRVREGRSGYEYVICRGPESGINEDIVLTEVDIDNIIRAKGAMFSGYTCLLAKIGLDVHSLDRVIIAGAFGSFINLEHAITIGLLPDIPRDKFHFIGNSSLKGARLAALDRNLFHRAKAVAASMMNVELSEDPSYMDNFVAALFLPHTRSELFPSVKIAG
jgi:uncharacterized 2Fe-2S/4Fe-4S cluster protein (DUF4445 family)